MLVLVYLLVIILGTITICFVPFFNNQFSLWRELNILIILAMLGLFCFFLKLTLGEVNLRKEELYIALLFGIFLIFSFLMRFYKKRKKI